MAAPTVLILSNGGLCSLVATATVFSAPNPPTVATLQITDSRMIAKHRYAYAQKQAKHFGFDPPLEWHLPRPPATNTPSTPPPAHPPKYAQTRLLFLALLQAIELRVDTLLWPVTANAHIDTAARIAEQIELLSNALELHTLTLPHVDAPLLELNDQQIIELGSQLAAPWQLAWTCQFNGDNSCRVCDPCRRRQRAFQAAGTVDPTADTGPR